MLFFLQCLCCKVGFKKARTLGMEQNLEFGWLKEAFVQACVGQGREEALEKTVVSQTDRDRD